MYDSYNYPAGADTPSAPWNEVDIPEQEFNVVCSQTLSKSASVWTSNYIPGNSGVDYEVDDEGHPYASSWQDPDDTSDTNWAEEWKENNHYTPLQLIELFKKYLENDLNRFGDTKDSKRLKHLIEECSDWVEDETEYVED